MDPLSEKQPEVLVLPSQKHRRGQVLALLVLTLLAGFVGGLVAPRAEQYLGAHVPFLAVSPSVAPSTNQTRVVIEDTVVADLVEQHTPSVVSIVISKDVPKVRNFSAIHSECPFSVRLARVALVNKTVRKPKNKRSAAALDFLFQLMV